MPQLRYFALLALLLALSTVSIDARSQNLRCDPDNGGITLPDGFCAIVVADLKGNARHLTINENGDIYVALRRSESRKGVAALRDENGDGRADRVEYFADQNGSGIGLHNGYLYFGANTSVMRFHLDEGQLVPTSSPEVIIQGLPEQNQHEAKTLTFDNQNNIFINIGAPSNACQERARSPGSKGLDPCPQLERQSGVWRFDANKTNQAQTDGERYATGIRNAMGLRWNPYAKKLYTMQHGRDQLGQLWGFTDEQNAELPAEEMFQVNRGDDFGWPYCYYDHLQNKKVLAPEYGGDGKIVGRCANFKDPVIGFPGHWAPNGMVFHSGKQFPAKYKHGAFVGFQGSWNRAPLEQRGYKVAFVPFNGDKPSGGYEVFADNFAGVETIRSPGQAKHRPMGVSEGPDGSLYISDFTAGRIWRVIYQP